MNIFRKYLSTPLIIAAILGVWELCVWLFKVPQLVLPAPSAIILNIAENYPRLFIHTQTTVMELLPGFLVGAVLGIGVATLMTEFALFRRTVYPFIIASQTIPKIAIAPLVIIWFGVGIVPKIFFVALLAFFPVLINTMAGFSSVDRRYLDLMHSVNAKSGETYRHIRFPAAVPHIFAGLKLGITVSVIGALVGEFVASKSGLGYLLLYYTQFLDMTSAFAVLVVLMSLGLACFGAVELLESLFSWDRKARQRGQTATAESSL